MYPVKHKNIFFSNSYWWYAPAPAFLPLMSRVLFGVLASAAAHDQSQRAGPCNKTAMPAHRAEMLPRNHNLKILLPHFWNHFSLERDKEKEVQFYVMIPTTYIYSDNL